MEESIHGFQYQPLIDVPAEVREIPLAGVECRKGTFAEAEEVFQRLRARVNKTFADEPFLRLHCLRMIESELLILAVVMKEPLPVCRRYLRRRLDLEYGRFQIGGKTGDAHLIANYAVDCGQTDFAIAILSKEYEQLNELSQSCAGWMESTELRINQLRQTVR